MSDLVMKKVIDVDEYDVMLPKNVILRKECEEINSPTHRERTFPLDWNFL